MQAPIEVTERSGEVFLLDILSHRMCEMAMLRQHISAPHALIHIDKRTGRAHLSGVDVGSLFLAHCSYLSPSPGMGF